MKKPTIYLKDYRPPDYSINFVELEFTLGEQATLVRSRLSISRSGTHARPLVLDGEQLALNSLRLDGALIATDQYALAEDKLTLPTKRDNFELELEVTIHPQDNTTLSGLYCSSGSFCTQCEAEGFRRITYFVDRPDLLTRYKTTITADKKKYPVLLSNGNLITRQDLDNGRHQAVWEDPHPKPSYLFALVAGNLAHIHDRFTTHSGRSVDLYIYTEHHNIEKCDHAMASLKKAMLWDEQIYGREYDLDLYMIVAVDDFNMGAMENKGLNIFNSKYILAKPETATDADYEAIEGVVAHEYFHNWSGNRVTCRDWFQLSLKEGFTVFRDQEFSADMGSRGVKRIQDVKVIRENQFLEDSGPLAHPVRPQSYQEINNFYTVTVYNKGAEVVRMLYHLVGRDGFRRGTDHYFDKYDGQAVTTDDFVSVMASENNVDLLQFKRWYDQAGTPLLQVKQRYNAGTGIYSLDIEQSCPPIPGQSKKHPLHIPLSIALLNANGRHMTLNAEAARQLVLEIKRQKQTFTFEHINSKPVLSALRGFSAPVKINIDYTDDDLYFLLLNDTDPFSRWEAAQQLSTQLILEMIHALQRQTQPAIDNRYLSTFVSLLQSDDSDCALLAQLLRLPSETYIGEFMEVIDPEAVHLARAHLKSSLSTAYLDSLHKIYNRYVDEPYQTSAESIGRRSLKNTCLDFILSADTEAARQVAVNQFSRADNMTDTMAALSALNNSTGMEREQAMDSFYSKFKHDNLVVDKWLGLQATSRLPDTLERVRQLTSHESFNLHNPNKIRALIGSFAHGNTIRFHDQSGRGYTFIADYVIDLDKTNPQVAARLTTVFNNWRRYDEPRQKLMSSQLRRILASSGLSNDVEEIAAKALA